MIRLVMALAGLLAGGSGVQAAELQVLTAGAYRSALVALAPGFEQASGHRLVIRNETAGGVQQKLRAGDPADVVVLPPSGIGALGALIAPGSARGLAKVGIAIAVPRGAPHPDVSTPEAVRAAVLASRAPAWIDPAAGGSSGIYMAGLWTKWGIAEQLAGKAVLVQGGLVSDKLVSGAADLAFQQRSELENHGVDVLGPLPAAIQTYTVYAGAVPAASGQAAAGLALLDYLAGPAAAPVLARMGMEAP